MAVSDTSRAIPGLCSFSCLSLPLFLSLSLSLFPQDIYVGLLFSSFLLLFVLPLVEYSDYLLLSRPLAPAVTVVLSFMAIIFYPGSDRWTPAR